MGPLRRFGIPLPFGRANRLQHPCPHLLTAVTYTTATSDRGLPEVRLDLAFARRSGAANPHMSLAMLVDRGGRVAQRATGMQVVDLFAGMPPYISTAPPAIVRYVASYRAGCDLVFYDNEVSPAGSIRQSSDFHAALAAHPPRGHTSQPLAAIAETSRRLAAGRGLYVLVWANGLTADSVRLIHEILERDPPPDNPYGLRVHLVDTGAGMALGERRQVAREFSRPGPSLLRYQSGYLVSREGPRVDPALVGTICDQLDRSLIGISGEVTVGEPAPQGGTLRRVANRSSGRWYDGPLCAIGFVPLRAQLGLEFAQSHPPSAEIVIRYFDGAEDQEIPLHIPLPLGPGTAVSG